MLNILLVGGALALICVAVVLVLRARPGQQSSEPQNQDELGTITGWVPHATRVLTSAECLAFATLRTALPEHIILAQVPLARFIKVPTRNSYSEWLRRAGRLCVDLVVCDRNSLVIAVVEIQTAKALAEGAQRRQQRAQRVLKAAHIPVHVWQDTALPSAEFAREAILRLLPNAENGPESENTTQPFAGTDYADTLVQKDAPPSTWLDDLGTDPAPLYTEADFPIAASKNRATH
jgi:hypothetical protein